LFLPLGLGAAELQPIRLRHALFLGALFGFAEAVEIDELAHRASLQVSAPARYVLALEARSSIVRFRSDRVRVGPRSA